MVQVWVQSAIVSVGYFWGWDSGDLPSCHRSGSSSTLNPSEGLQSRALSNAHFRCNGLQAPVSVDASFSCEAACFSSLLLQILVILPWKIACFEMIDLSKMVSKVENTGSISGPSTGGSERFGLNSSISQSKDSPSRPASIFPSIPRSWPWGHLTGAESRLNQFFFIAGWWLSPTPLKKKYYIVSWDQYSQYMIIFGKIKNVPNHQPNSKIFLRMFT